MLKQYPPSWVYQILFGELASRSSNAAIFRSINEQNPIILHNGVEQKSSFGGCMGCNHITIFERESILLGTLQGLSIAKIAENPSRSKSTISRELKRNSQDESYSPIIADNKCKSRRKNCKTDKKLSDKTLCDFVAGKLLNRQWSPEEISGRARSETGDGKLGYHTIHRGIKDGIFDKYRRGDGKLKASRRLRHRGKRRHKKGKNDDIDENEKFSETLLKQITA